MTTTNKDRATLLRAAANALNGTEIGVGEIRASLRAEADRLDPPAPTGKTVTWNGRAYRMSEHGIESRDPSPAALTNKWTTHAISREFIDAVVLPLLADAPDGPIPDETVEKAWRAFKQAEMSEADERDAMECALTEVRGLPGMAVVRAGKPPEVLGWGILQYGLLTRVASEKHARQCAKDFPDSRVVAIIADPKEGTP